MPAWITEKGYIRVTFPGFDKVLSWEGGSEMLTDDEVTRILMIKRDFSSRNKWSKQDYSDFYFRDVTLLLAIVARLSGKPSEQRSKT